jgi:hypothetical protein
MTRVNEFANFNLNGYMIPRHQPMVIFSRNSALDAEVWIKAGRELSKPLEEFDAERLLLNPDSIQKADASKSEQANPAKTRKQIHHRLSKPVQIVQDKNSRLSSSSLWMALLDAGFLTVGAKECAQDGTLLKPKSSELLLYYSQNTTLSLATLL